MDGARKRSAATRPRGDIPPSKKRQAEQPSAADRYAHPLYSRVSTSPAYTKENSAAHTRKELSGNPKNERHVDQNRRNSYRDAVNGPESFQNVGRQASRNSTASNSPLQVMSPMSNHSGSSTPAQAAPVVPSMVPVAQKATASQSASMDVLDALRSRKASLAVSIAEANGGVTIQEINLLKAKLKAAELRESQYRSECGILDSRLKQLEVLPAQLAALKDQIEQQQQTAAKGPSLEVVETRISALENAKPSVTTTQFEEIQSHVHSLKLETEKLNKIAEELVPLQAMVSQQGQDIAKALSRNADIKTEVDNLVTLREEVKTLQEQQKQTQALRSDFVENLARTGLDSDNEKLRKLEGIQVQQQAIIEKLSMSVDGSQKVIEDVSTKVEANQTSLENMDATLQVIQTTANDLRALDLRVRVANLEERVGRIDKNDDSLESEHDKTANHTQHVSPQDFNELRDLVIGIREDNEKLAKGLQNIQVASGQPKLQDKVDVDAGIQPSLSAKEVDVGEISGLNARFDQLETNVEEITKDIDYCQDKIDKLNEGIVSMFKDIFDPFKTWVEERCDEQVSSLTKVNETLAILQGKVEESQKECPATTFSAPLLKSIQSMVEGAVEVKQDLSRLQDFVRSESNRRVAAVEDLQQQLATKQDTAAANSLIDTIRHSLRALTSQYENIVSDDLHQKMTHWFMQFYGNPNANLLKHIPDINLQLQEMRSLTDVFTRIPNSAQALGTLAQLEPQLKSLAEIVPQLTVLAQSPLAPEGSHELSAKTAESLRTMGDGLAKAVQEHSDLARVVKGLQGSLHSLNKIPFAKADSINALEKSIVSLQAELKASIEAGAQARREFETKAGNDHKQRVESEKSIKSSIGSVSNSVEKLSKRMDEEVKERETADGEILSVSKDMVNGCMNAQQRTSDLLEKTQKALGQLRSEFDDALSDVNDPKNKEALACLPILFLHVGQLQWVLEELNKNLPRGGLDIEWHNDFKEKWPIPSPFIDAEAAPATPKGKGKSKRQE